MEIIERSETRLVLTTKAGSLTYIGGLIAIGLGLLLIFGGNHVENNNPIFEFIVGPIGVIAGMTMLLSPSKCILTIDRKMHQFSIKKVYLFDLIPLTHQAKLADLTEFKVQHQLAYKLHPATLKFIFKAGHRRFTFSSGKLHFPDGATYFNQITSDPRNASEEALIPVVASYVNQQATLKERRIDSTKLQHRLLYISLIFVCGLILAIVATWAYFHLIHTH